ncbi:TIGR00282 family metallophosphoesterase [Bacillus fonticola]|uniref:TIGR00282 family metallophosphoesterase n=1 Tax=Bacillus fonticola TaxID=2728853 RepID=UPI001475AE42|nr:TIGR00282 family metallophosphoesterase [Bacillus fonticola]
MRILFVGDVVSSLGRTMIKEYLPRLRKKYMPHATIVNGENAAGGKGITHKIYRELREWGADCVTLGNHTWGNKEIFDFIDEADALIRPANFPKGNPGVGVHTLKVLGTDMAVVNIQGRTFMPPIDCPFETIENILEELKPKHKVIFVDFHGEATSEKQAMGHFLDGKVSVCVGTHTHIPTADARILPNGTAYITDVGMTGPYDEVIGTKKDTIIRRFRTQLPERFEVPKEGRTQLSAVVVDVDSKTGTATKIEQVLINDDHPFFD